jgi:hypothetical protein
MYNSVLSHRRPIEQLLYFFMPGLDNPRTMDGCTAFPVFSILCSAVSLVIQAGVAEPADARDLNVSTVFDFVGESRPLSADYPHIKMRQKMTRLSRVAL